MVEWMLLLSLLLGVVAPGAIAVWLRAARRRRSRPDETFVGRQQIRRAARQEASRLVSRAPIARRIRRDAAREIARKAVR